MTLAYIALALVLSITLGALLSRWYVAPIAPRSPRLMLRTGGTEVTDLGWCPAEEQERLHEFHADGSRTCWTCRTRTKGGAQ